MGQQEMETSSSAFEELFVVAKEELTITHKSENRFADPLVERNDIAESLYNLCCVYPLRMPAQRLVCNCQKRHLKTTSNRGTGT
jgi:hypothetical protein